MNTKTNAQDEKNEKDKKIKPETEKITVPFWKKNNLKAPNRFLNLRKIQFHGSRHRG